jgi:Fe-S-cluster containining protein
MYLNGVIFQAHCVFLNKKRTKCNITHFKFFINRNRVIFQAYCVNFDLKKIKKCNTTHFQLFPHFNGVIFQAHCVYFEIKITNCRTTDLKLFLCLLFVLILKEKETSDFYNSNFRDHLE